VGMYWLITFSSFPSTFFLLILTGMLLVDVQNVGKTPKITSSLKSWRRKDMMRLLKQSFQQTLQALRGAEMRELSPAVHVEQAISFVENEVIFKYDLAPAPVEHISVLEEDGLPPIYKKYIRTIIHNLVPKTMGAYLPRHLQWRDAAQTEQPIANAKQEEEYVSGEEEQLEPIESNSMELHDLHQDAARIDNNEYEEPRKRVAKRRNGDLPQEEMEMSQVPSKKSKK
jgi:hypothetical protein